MHSIGWSEAAMAVSIPGSSRFWWFSTTPSSFSAFATVQKLVDEEEAEQVDDDEEEEYLDMEDKVDEEERHGISGREGKST